MQIARSISTVYRGVCSVTHVPVIIKAYEKAKMKPKNFQRMEREVRLMRLLGGGDGLVELLAVFEDTLCKYLVGVLLTLSHHYHHHLSPYWMLRNSPADPCAAKPWRSLYSPQLFTRAHDRAKHKQAEVLTQIMEHCRGGDLFKTLMMKGGSLDEAWVCTEVRITHATGSKPCC